MRYYKEFYTVENPKKLLNDFNLQINGFCFLGFLFIKNKEFGALLDKPQHYFVSFDYEVVYLEFDPRDFQFDIKNKKEVFEYFMGHSFKEIPLDGVESFMIESLQNSDVLYFMKVNMKSEDYFLIHEYDSGLICTKKALGTIYHESKILYFNDSKEWAENILKGDNVEYVEITDSQISYNDGSYILKGFYETVPH